MTENSKIQWTDHTFNPWHGCAKVSPGCDNCYAEAQSNRFHPGLWGVDAARRVWDDLAAGARKHWDEPLGWNRKAEKAGERHRVFSGSMCDVFDKHPAANDERPNLWHLIHKTPALDWLLLTKRVGNVARMVPESWMRCGFPKNVWLGISVVNQEEADRDIPKLLALPARVRFLSCEPLLGPVDLKWHFVAPTGNFRTHEGRRQMECRPHGLLHWAIVGGESGLRARPFDVSWARSIVEQCRAAGVACFVKQLGAKPIAESLPQYGPVGVHHVALQDRKGGDPAEWPVDLRVREFPRSAA